MSDTPRTDARQATPIGFYSCATVPADFARQLERELNEWRKCAEGLRPFVTSIDLDPEWLCEYIDALATFRELKSK